MCVWDRTGRRRDKEQKSSLLYADVKPRNRESQSIPHEKQGIKLAPHDEGMIRHSIKKIRKIPWNCIWGHESLTPIIKKPKPSIWLTLSIRKTLGGVARSWLQDRQIWLTALCWITVLWLYLLLISFCFCIFIRLFVPDEGLCLSSKICRNKLCVVWQSLSFLNMLPLQQYNFY